MNASYHAREWLTSNLVMYQIDQYSQAFINQSSIDGYNIQDLLSKVSIYYVPMVNPDGVTLNQLGAGGFSNKNELIKMNNGSSDFSAWKANARGLNLNRQYPSGWRTINNNVRSPSYAFYKGVRPFSKSETKALYDFTLSHDFKTYVAYHSSGEIYIGRITLVQNATPIVKSLI
ncbi:M14 family zinc carboxypeptidase [Paraliobacillus ryukyuensis]|uniref:M14 family zinc carboxypeptidase n=1 Tax=Paraliobacillus ryukyuensis TaxID=200904 RepID=UPI002482DBD9|nr:M14 family zinc carboxypeptidase [Paraliobacillus ryukyuensis]